MNFLARILIAGAAAFLVYQLWKLLPSSIKRLLITGVTILLVAYFFPSLIEVKDFLTALLAALILAVVNALIRPVVIFITLPLNFLTLGLFTLVVNAFMLYIVSFILGEAFQISGFWQALVAAFIISIVSAFASQLTEK